MCLSYPLQFYMELLHQAVVDVMEIIPLDVVEIIRFYADGLDVGLFKMLVIDNCFVVRIHNCFEFFFITHIGGEAFNHLI